MIKKKSKFNGLSLAPKRSWVQLSLSMWRSLLQIENCFF